MKMKKLLIVFLTVIALVSCSSAGQSESGDDGSLSNKDKVVALLNSIESGDAAPAAYINPEKYIQHNLGVADGLAGFGAVLAALDGAGKVRVVRVFQDGDYVFTHTEYDFFGPKTGFDIFRFEDGLIVEHWDNLQDIVPETVSGRTQFDGPVEITDSDKTEENKDLIHDFIADILMGGGSKEITEYVSTNYYHQHNPGVGDGLEGLGTALQALAEAGIPMVYEQNHFILGEGNFVLAASEGVFLGDHVAFYDLFRIENGLIVEHWDAIQEIPDESEWMNANGKF